jgi:hypothetical protein
MMDSETVGSDSSTLDEADLAVHRGRAVIFHCRSGARTRRNAAALGARVDESCEAFMLEGGLEGWRKAGLPTVVDRRQPIELQRQVQIGAGGPPPRFRTFQVCPKDLASPP